MAEIQPPETNGGGGQQFLVGPSETVGTKRQRRPSVRLGEIGGDDLRRSNKQQQQQQWRLPPPIENHRNSVNKSSSSKTRPLVNLSSGGGDGFHETLERDERDGGGNLDSVAIGSWKVKDAKKRASSKRLRSNWVSAKIDEGGGGAEKFSGGGAEKFSGGEDGEDGYREFRVEDSESPLKEQSPIQSSENLDNLGVDGLYHGGSRRQSRVRVSDQEGMELSGPSETDAREWNGTSGDRNNGNEGGRDGVRVWLNGLGLSRYAPVFEIHEVDDEVLAMLTLEDLKDMGINAVGSRRKMYCAIQKLGKGFS